MLKLVLIEQKNQLDNYSVEKDSTIGKNNEPSTLSEVTSTNAKISPNKESIIKQIKLGNFMDEKADLANSALDMNIDNIYLTNTSTSSNVKLIDPKNCSIGEKITKNQSNNITVEIGLIINKNNERSTLSEVTLKNAMISPNKEPVYKKIKLIHHTDKITNLAISKNVFIKDDGLCLNNISCTLSEGTLRNAENSSVNEQNTKNKMNNQTIKISNSTTSINDDGLCLSYALSTLPDATMINAENSPITEPITKNSKCLDQNDDFFTIYNSSFSNSDVVVSNDENMFVGGSKSNRNELNNHCVEITNSIKSEITAEIVKSKPLMSVRSEFSLSNSFNGVYSIDKTTTEPRNHRNVEKNNLLENALRKKNSSVLSKKKNSKNNPNLSRTLKKSTKTQVKSPCTNFTVENNPQQFNIAHDSSTSIHLSSYNNIYNSGTFNLQPNNEKDYVSVTPSIQPPINVNYYYSNPIVSLHSFVNGTQQVAMNTSHLISNTQYSNNNLQDSPVIRSRAQPSRILKNNQNSTNTIAQSSVSRSSIYTHSSTSINTQTSVTSDSRSNRLIENTFCNTAQNNSTSNNYYNSATTNNCITYDHVFHDLPNTSFSHPNNNTSSKFNQFSFPPIAGVPYFGNRNSTEPPLNNASFREASINNYLFQNHLNSHYNQNWNKQMSMSSQQVANATVDSFQPSNHNSQSRCMATNCTNCSNCKTGCYCFICYKK
uniref:Uncharacterized protein n=1 Tax=Sipha flava TaxID=143950 RepID=A0A2S2QLJ0_9HEMI